jgi:hypothetical protein
MTTPQPDLSQLPPDLKPQEIGVDEFIQGRPHGERTLALLLKRTFAITPNGECELADEQEPIVDGELLYDLVAAPFRSSVRFGNDALAFKDRTDVVVQGSAYAYEHGTRRTTVSFRIGDLAREIVVYGDRHGEWSNGGGPRFSEPDSFESVPVRWERAYGGPDLTALERYGWAVGEALDTARPEWDLASRTPYHYPRNPCGCGYLIELDRESFEDLPIPNLEFPFDQLVPERLAVGAADRWIHGPLPAGMDWVGSGWYPRTGYLGLAPRYELRDEQPAEVELGWATQDLAVTASILENSARPPRQEYFQAAAPGLVLPTAAAGCSLEITNMHPDVRVRVIRLPAEVPQVRLGFERGRLEALDTRLSTIVVRPDLDEIVLTWCARTPVSRAYSLEQVDAMRRDVRWRKA